MAIVEWFELLDKAEKTEEPSQALALFEQAIELAQKNLGPYDPNLANCFMRFGNYLEDQKRYEDAALRFKLAAGIFKQADRQGAFSLAQAKATQMQLLSSRNQS